MANMIRRTQGQETSPSATVWDPFRAMRDILRWDPFREGESALGADYQTFLPRFDVKETKEAYVIKADLPGVKDDELDVSLNGNLLSISGKREPDRYEEGDAYHAIERSYGSFSRSFTMPESVDGAAVTADLKNGVLTVLIPKKAEAQPRRIAIGKGGEAKAKA